MNFEASKSQLMPVKPYIPDQEQPQIIYAVSYEQLKAFRLFSQPYVVRANYDVVQQAIEDGIMSLQDKHYKEWLSWVANNI